jgi:hypothetical protein
LGYPENRITVNHRAKQQNLRKNAFVLQFYAAQKKLFVN